MLATGLAVTAANQGRRALLVDGDPLSGGLDLLLGWEDDQGLRWPELASASGQVDPARFLAALPGRGELAVVSFDRRDLPAMPAEAMTAVLAAGRAARDLVVVDLPRQLDEAATAALQAADQGLLVVPAEVRAVAAAAKVVTGPPHTAPSCGSLSAVRHRVNCPGEDIADALGLPLAGTLRPEAGLPAALEGGLPPTASGRGPLAVLCRRLVSELCRPEPAVAA